jgi:hypothetical protein
MDQWGLLALSTENGERGSLPLVEEKSSGPSVVRTRSLEAEDARIMLPMPPIPDDCYM